jgi:hypothetical protein
MMIERMEEQPKGGNVVATKRWTGHWNVRRPEDNGREKKTETGGVVASRLRRGWSWETEERSEAKETPRRREGWKVDSSLMFHATTQTEGRKEPKTKQTQANRPPQTVSLVPPKQASHSSSSANPSVLSP